MKKLRKVLIAFLLLVLVCSSISLTLCVVDYYRTLAKIDTIKKLSQKTSKEKEPGKSLVLPGSEGCDMPSSERAVLPELQAMYELNGDFAGWLEIENTLISYPVMQNPEDPEYYLGHDFNGIEDKNGLPFLDAQCSPEQSGVLLIHGHNMKSGLIFGQLKKYKDEAYYREHPVIRFSSLYESGDYEIIAVVLSQVYQKSNTVFKYYQLGNTGTQPGFDSYVQSIKALALYETGLTGQYGDKLLVLSTCDSWTQNGRLAVVARKMP